MQDRNDIDQPERNQEPPFLRWIVVGFGLMLGSLFSAWCAATQVPTSGFLDWVLVWLLFMSGPMAAPLFAGTFQMGQPFDGLIGLGFVSIPMIAAHPINPNGITAFMTLLGFVFWFAASFVSIICMVWGA